jgi:hypothetical protein
MDLSRRATPACAADFILESEGNRRNVNFSSSEHLDFESVGATAWRILAHPKHFNPTSSEQEDTSVEARDHLVISGIDGGLNQYRIRAGTLQFRCITEDTAGQWRILSEEDVLMHLVLKTSVAQWLYARVGVQVEAGSKLAA